MLSEPKLVQGDRLMRFDVVLANPHYSIKQRVRTALHDLLRNAPER